MTQQFLRTKKAKLLQPCSVVFGLVEKLKALLSLFKLRLPCEKPRSKVILGRKIDFMNFVGHRK